MMHSCGQASKCQFPLRLSDHHILAIEVHDSMVQRTLPPVLNALDKLILTKNVVRQHLPLSGIIVQLYI